MVSRKTGRGAEPVAVEGAYRSADPRLAQHPARHPVVDSFTQRKTIMDNLYKFIVPAVAGPARLVPLAALATDEFNATALRVAANRGALQATKGSDGQWRSSRQWVEEYAQSRYKRRG